ncbi:prefoldin subunit [Cryptococcus wingfieldii CBS 7118]|uniref:Prefoldin subunit 3 n=1 Tax=Cryptococcus wingfieldii CBS 7118 TaxID=1295528 RepID=A0A1E3J6A3_9TREE|nr:prefoldin subunit [Cryptococcus wingfieldii CBS 7118]ODN96388.1 prefoldin subunit [Cryptococcus wingfieldii CBS 7118]
MATTSSKQMEVNPRGIPRAPFVDNVEEYVGGKEAEVQSTMKKFEDTTAKYRYMEVTIGNRRKALLNKVPDIEQTLQVVKFLQQRRQKALGESPLKTLFELNDTLFAEAEVSENGEVGLWLGANTMLMYPLQEAVELLSSKLSAAQRSLGETAEDLEWLREQITVMEVNFARVHNWDVKRRREKGLIGGQSNMLPSGKNDGGDSDEERD